MSICLIKPLGLLTSQQPTWLRFGAKIIAFGTQCFIGFPIVGTQHFQAFLDAQVFIGSQEAIYRQKPYQAFGGCYTQNRNIFKPSPTAQYRSDFKFFKTTDLHRPSPTWCLTFFSIFQHSGCTVHRFLRSQEAIYQPKPNQVVLGRILG